MSHLSQPSGPPADAACRNCGRPAGPRFCGHCGQEVEPWSGPLLSVLLEILSDWLSLDGRLARTLARLAVPGRLTERYLAGHRVDHLRPFRLYLVASLLLFSTALSLRAPDAGEVNFYLAGQLVTEAPADPDRLNLTLFETDSLINRWLARLQARELEELRRLPPQELLDQLFAGLRRVLPSALVLFVPFLALALKALYLRSGVLYVDHLIFALHFQSALFLALAVAWLLARLLGLGLVSSLLTYVVAGSLTLFLYLPLALRRVYLQRWRWTVLKTLLLFLIYGQLLKLIGGAAVLFVTSTLS